MARFHPYWKRSLRPAGTACLAAIVIMTCATTPARAQHLPSPEVMWQRTAMDDTTLALPYGLEVDHKTGTVLVADMKLPGIVELSGTTGRMVRVLGKKGDGPGEFNMPQRLALSPNGKLLAVYDIGRRSVDILTREGKQVRRIPIGTIPFLKGMAVSDDTTIVLAGGRLASGRMPSAITWIQHGAISSTGPVPPSVPGLEEDRDLDGRVYAAGGPLMLRGEMAVLADAGSGDIWHTSPLDARKVADGPGAPPDLVASIIQPTEVDGQQLKRISFNFPQAILVDTTGVNRYLVGYSDKAAKRLTFYLDMPGAATKVLSSWGISPSVMARFDPDTFVVLELGEDGWRLSRVRMPVS